MKNFREIKTWEDICKVNGDDPSVLPVRKMKTRPILFSTAMVQALLSGRKTMTRRIAPFDKDCTSIEKIGKKYQEVYNHSGIKENAWVALTNTICKYGQVGDILWVRETFCLTTPYGPENYYFGYKDGSHSRNEASERYDFESPDKWKPCIHMPKEACRLWLEITNMRVERLNDIGRLDALAEGICERVELEDTIHEKNYYQHKFGGLRHPSAVDAFIDLWEEINGWSSWGLNPWVWVIEFKKVEMPAGFLEGGVK